MLWGKKKKWEEGDGGNGYCILGSEGLISNVSLSRGLNKVRSQPVHQSREVSF